MDEFMTLNKAWRELKQSFAEATGLYRLMDWILKSLTRLTAWLNQVIARWAND